MSSVPSDFRRPDFKYLFASGLLGFVLGAFVVASLGNMSGWRANGSAGTATTPIGGRSGPAKTPASAAIDEAPSAVVEVPVSAFEEGSEQGLEAALAQIQPKTIVAKYSGWRTGESDTKDAKNLAAMGDKALDKFHNGTFWPEYITMEMCG